jgi:alpha-L-fucosidase
MSIAKTLVLVFLVISCTGSAEQKKQPGSNKMPGSKEMAYEATWESLKQHDTPQWLRDAKFGIYTHWGIYCYSATRGNATWNSHAAYNRPESEAARDFYEKFGELTPEFGYKDLIPRFTAEKFDAEEWADLFAKSGAKFAGPVAEHHDGFAMWDTRYSEWNAATMGPKRDVVGELEKAIKAKNMKFVTAFHHAANWTFFPTWDKTKDCSNPEFSGLYGPVHQQGEMPSKEFLDEWYGKLTEVVDKYDPDFVWFDFALDRIREDYVKNFVAYYYNKAVERGKDVVITYKGHDLPPGVALLDHELGQEPELTYYDWITDNSIDVQGAWGYIEGLEYKTVDRLVDNLVDRVSKNGYLLLNIGPRWDGTIPEGAKEGLLGMGEWLDVNGEAIYGTASWTKSGEGPTSVKLSERDGRETGHAGFNESDIVYTNRDIRFTVNGNTLYAIMLDWSEGDVMIKSLVRENAPGYYIYPEEIASVTMLGDGKELDWELVEGEGLRISPPDTKPCEHAFVFKIVRQY